MPGLTLCALLRPRGRPPPSDGARRVVICRFRRLSKLSEGRFLYDGTQSIGEGSGWRSRWTFSLYPQAGEGGGCFVPLLPREGSGGGPPDPGRALEEAGRRARSKLRRYCAANRLNRLGTLTYAGAGCHDPQELRSDVSEFFRRLRRELGGRALPYAWTSEWHPGGHGLHVHFAVGRYVRQRLIREVWGLGITHIKLIGDLPVGSGALEEARIAAGYLAKYVSKSLAADRTPGLHRYEVAQGFQPERIRLAASSEEGVIARACERMGGEPSRVWRSAQREGWRAPPAYWCAWAG